MISKWLGPLALLAVLVIGDQIRINRPGHKYRLTVAVQTPDGVKSATGVMAVVPDRGYSRGGHTSTKGDALVVDLGGGKILLALLAHLDDTKLDLDGMNYLALRAYGAAGGRRVSFNEMSRTSGVVPVTGTLIPLLASFADANDPATAGIVNPDDLEATFGKGYQLGGVTAEVVPNGFWPIDFGGALGEPVSRGIEAKLTWWNRPDDPAAVALKAMGLKGGGSIDANEIFTRK
jgi:hypothetical protein